MDDRQMTPRGHPDFNSYVKNVRVLVFRTDGRTDREINPVWASLTTFLQVNKKISSSLVFTIEVQSEDVSILNYNLFFFPIGSVFLVQI